VRYQPKIRRLIRSRGAVASGHAIADRQETRLNSAYLEPVGVQNSKALDLLIGWLEEMCYGLVLYSW
jgi:hypothetical protein